MSAFDAIKRWLPFVQRSNEVALPRAAAMKAVFDIYRKTMFDPVRRVAWDELGMPLFASGDKNWIGQLCRMDRLKTGIAFHYYVCCVENYILKGVLPEEEAPTGKENPDPDIDALYATWKTTIPKDAEAGILSKNLSSLENEAYQARSAAIQKTIPDITEHMELLIDQKGARIRGKLLDFTKN